MTGAAFVACTATSKFPRTLRNKIDAKKWKVVYWGIKTNSYIFIL